MAKESPRCRCGHDRTHYMVTPDPVYSVMGWARVLMGISTRPLRIKYHCRRCDQIITESTAAQDLDSYY